MNVTRFDEAPEYFPANHFLMRCPRLQGQEAGPAESLWLGVSTLAPGERRALRNRSDRPAQLLLAMPFARPASR